MCMAVPCVWRDPCVSRAWVSVVCMCVTCVRIKTVIISERWQQLHKETKAKTDAQRERKREKGKKGSQRNREERLREKELRIKNKKRK